jgi:hypothetical protein
MASSRARHRASLRADCYPRRTAISCAWPPKQLELSSLLEQIHSTRILSAPPLASLVDLFFGGISSTMLGFRFCFDQLQGASALGITSY